MQHLDSGENIDIFITSDMRGTEQKQFRVSSRLTLDELKKSILKELYNSDDDPLKFHLSIAGKYLNELWVNLIQATPKDKQFICIMKNKNYFVKNILKQNNVIESFKNKYANKELNLLDLEKNILIPAKVKLDEKILTDSYQTNFMLKMYLSNQIDLEIGNVELTYVMEDSMKESAVYLRNISTKEKHDLKLKYAGVHLMKVVWDICLWSKCTSIFLHPSTRNHDTNPTPFFKIMGGKISLLDNTYKSLNSSFCQLYQINSSDKIDEVISSIKLKTPINNFTSLSNNSSKSNSHDTIKGVKIVQDKIIKNSFTPVSKKELHESFKKLLFPSIDQELFFKDKNIFSLMENGILQFETAMKLTIDQFIILRDDFISKLLIEGIRELSWAMKLTLDEYSKLKNSYKILNGTN